MKPCVVELGCGINPTLEHAFKIDRDPYPQVDLIADLEKGLTFFADASVDEVHSHHLLEHIDDLAGLLGEIHRVLKPGGICAGSVPHFANPYFYSDPTHQRTFGLYTFSYFCTNGYFFRGVPSYGGYPRFRCRELSLGFRSPFRWRHKLRRAFGLVVNSSRWMLEFYEENLCWLVPAYEIRFVLEKTP